MKHLWSNFDRFLAIYRNFTFLKNCILAIHVRERKSNAGHYRVSRRAAVGTVLPKATIGNDRFRSLNNGSTTARPPRRPSTDPDGLDLREFPINGAYRRTRLASAPITFPVIHKRGPTADRRAVAIEARLAPAGRSKIQDRQIPQQSYDIQLLYDRAH